MLLPLLHLLCESLSLSLRQRHLHQYVFFFCRARMEMELSRSDESNLPLCFDSLSRHLLPRHPRRMKSSKLVSKSRCSSNSVLEAAPVEGSTLERLILDPFWETGFA